MMVFISALMPLSTDTPTLAILLTFAGTVITAVAGAFVAINLNKNEKRQSAESSLEKALRERITLRDEELADLRQDLVKAEADRDAAIQRAIKAEQQRDRLYLAIAEQRAEERVHNDDS